MEDLSRGIPIIDPTTGKEQNLIEPVHFLFKCLFDKTSTASNGNWVGGALPAGAHT
jgi:hypothetical protein